MVPKAGLCSTAKQKSQFTGKQNSKLVTCNVLFPPKRDNKPNLLVRHACEFTRHIVFAILELQSEIGKTYHFKKAQNVDIRIVGHHCCVHLENKRIKLPRVSHHNRKQGWEEKANLNIIAQGLDIVRAAATQLGEQSKCRPAILSKDISITCCAWMLMGRAFASLFTTHKTLVARMRENTT